MRNEDDGTGRWWWCEANSCRILVPQHDRHLRHWQLLSLQHTVKTVFVVQERHEVVQVQGMVTWCLGMAVSPFCSFDKT